MKRHINAAIGTRYKVGDLVVDLKTRTVLKGSEHLSLPELTFDLFEKLVVESPNTVTKEMLLHDVWKTGSVTNETIAQRIALLRKALNDDPKRPSYIRTVRGIGYSLVAPVNPSQANKKLKGQVIRQTKLRLSVGIVMGVILACSALYIWQTNSRPSNEVAQEKINSYTSAANQQARQLLSVWDADSNERAIQLLTGVLNQYPDDATSKLTLSFALSSRKTKFSGSIEDAVMAETLAREVIDVDASNGMHWHALGYALDAQNKIDEAIAAFQKAYEINDKDLSAKSSAANLMFVRGRIYDALSTELSALNDDKSSIFAHLQVARSLDLLDATQSETWWEKALNLPLGRAQVLAARISALSTNERIDEALSILQTSDETLLSEQQRQLFKGRALMIKGEITRARTHLDNAKSMASHEIAILNAIQGEVDLALVAINHLHDEQLRGDSSPHSRIKLAELYAVTTQNDLALMALNDAVNLGWRDIDYIDSSISLNSVRSSNEYIQIKERIIAELQIQRALVEQIPQYLIEQ